MKYHEWIASRGCRLSAIVHQEGEANPDKPVIICCHGFTGDKVGANQLMLNLGKGIAAEGFTVIRFDFAGSGESEGEFAAATSVTGWREDLRNVVSWLRDRPEFERSPLYLLGHSLGGLIVLTSDLAEIAGRIVLAPVIHPIENFRNIILGPDLWQLAVKGETIVNFYGKGFSLEPGFVADLLAENYAPLTAASAYNTPLFIVHGDKDAAVPLPGSQELYHQYTGAKEIAVIDADHVFTGQHSTVKALITNWLHNRSGQSI